MKTIHLKTIDSTNTYAKNLGKSATEDILVIADKQTAGKGRLGRNFASPEGGIYMSLLLHPDGDAQFSLNITVMASVAVARAIEKLCNIKTQIKWVNDIYYNDKKLCGILTQGVVNPNTKKLDFAVLGIGLNLYKPKEDYPDEIKDVATYLLEKEEKDIKEKLIDAICKEFFVLYNGEDNDYIKEYKSRSLILGKIIQYEKDNNRYLARAVDITESGELVVKQEGKTVVLNSGEIKIDMKAFGRDL